MSVNAPQRTDGPLALTGVSAGFADPVHDAQRAFRTLMNAMARPGSRADLSGLLKQAPEGLDPAAAAVGLALLDFETPVHLGAPLRWGDAERFFRFHCGCPMTDDLMEATFAFARADADPPMLSRLNPGDPKYPDRSATLVLACPALDGGPPLRFSGPGIIGAATIAPLGLPAWFAAEWRANYARFQCGIDLILTAGTEAICLPRTAKLSDELG